MNKVNSMKYKNCTNIPLKPGCHINNEGCKEPAHHRGEEGGDDHREGEQGHILPGEVDDHDEAR